MSKSTTLFESKTVNHIKSYSLVQKTLTYVLSFTILAFFYQQLLIVANKFNELLITPYLSQYFALVDNKTNALLSNYLDFFLLKFFNSIKLINDFSSKKVNQIFPGSTSTIDSSNELEKSVQIVKTFVSSVYQSTVQNTNNVTHDIASTYSQEAKKVEGNVVKKNISASLNTANYSFETYIKPLQSKTSEIINDVTVQTKSKINDVTTQTKSKINDVTNQTKSKFDDVTSQAYSKAENVLNEGKKRAQEYVNLEEVPVVKASA